MSRTSKGCRKVKALGNVCDGCHKPFRAEKKG